MRRRFNTAERVALALSSSGRCESCGTELEPGWHADHATAYSHGGQTHVSNGRATCPTCNLKKGDRPLDNKSRNPRTWQPWRRASDDEKSAFLSEVNP